MNNRSSSFWPVAGLFTMNATKLDGSKACNAANHTIPRTLIERRSFLLYQVHPRLLQQVIYMARTVSGQAPEAKT